MAVTARWGMDHMTVDVTARTVQARIHVEVFTVYTTTPNGDGPAYSASRASGRTGAGRARHRPVTPARAGPPGPCGAGARGAA